MITTHSWDRLHQFHMEAYLANGKPWHLEMASLAWRAIVFQAGGLG